VKIQQKRPKPNRLSTSASPLVSSSEEQVPFSLSAAQNRSEKRIGGKRIALWIGIFLFLAAAGCNQSTRPELGFVHGKVTLDGKPVKGAGVGFRPKSGARESTGSTDAEGNYVLHYIREINGAAVGLHTVRISTGDIPRGIPELVPEKYNTKSNLQKEVIAGDNEINFELTTK
jgi:hypothetical protein